MIILLLAFLVLCSVSIIMSIHKLYRHNSMENVTVDISSVLYPMNNKAKARYMINLLDKGYVLKHILTNTAPEHNDKQYEESYSSFLNAEIIDIIKQVKGDHTYE